MKDLREKTKLIPVAFVLGYIPLIVRMHEYDSHFEDQEWFPVWDDGMMFDFFLYYKAAAVLITAAVMLFILIFDARKNGSFEKFKIWKRKWRFYELLLAGYLLAVLISGVVSRYRKPAFSGSAETFEPVPVILAYGVIFYYTACFVRSDDSVRSVLKMSLPGFLITGLTAVLQFFKADPFKSSIIKTLIIPGSYAQLKGDLAFTFAPGEVYATLFNSNYVPQYFGFAFFIGAFMAFGKGLKLSERITGAAAALISLISIAGSRSRTGYIAVALTVLLFLALSVNELMARKGILKGKRAGVFIMLTVLIAAGFLCLLLKDTDRKFLKMAGAVSDEEAEKLIKDVKTGDDCVEIVTDRETLSVTYGIEDGAFYADVEGSENGTYPLSLTDDQTGFVMTDEGLGEIEILPVSIEGEPRPCMAVRADGREMVFLKTGDEGYLYYNKAGRFVKFRKYDRSTFFPDGLFSDRGLLWNNCITMIPKSLCLGSGAGTFAYVYPNDDDYYRLYDDSGITFYDVKAHSIYFQQLIENGGMALLCFVCFYLVLVRCVLSARGGADGKGSLSRPLVIGILAGTVCYMLCCLTVDSNVTSAPVFWAFMGILAGAADIHT